MGNELLTKERMWNPFTKRADHNWRVGEDMMSSSAHALPERAYPCYQCAFKSEGITSGLETIRTELLRVRYQKPFPKMLRDFAEGALKGHFSLAGSLHCIFDSLEQIFRRAGNRHDIVQLHRSLFPL